MKAVKVGLALTVASLIYGAIPAAEPATDVDRAFVAKVSQGGLYEVEAGKIAASRGTVPVIKDFGVLDTHDHESVNSELKRIAGMTGVPIAPGLKPEFAQRLAKLKGTPASQFDSYYFSDMKQIHNTDEGLFIKEAEEGSGAYKQFAHQTAALVKAHLGWLNAT